VRYPAEPYQPFSNPPAISPPQGFFKGRPVVSVDEARAAHIDFDGSLYIFTDLGKGKIYTKQFNPDGTATLHTFVLAEEKDAEPSEYVTKAEFEAALSNIQATLGGVIKDAPSTPQQKKIEF
jgi:hypothetical protein